jgi:hypothetical protein
MEMARTSRSFGLVQPLAPLQILVAALIWGPHCQQPDPTRQRHGRTHLRGKLQNLRPWKHGTVTAV